MSEKLTDEQVTTGVNTLAEDAIEQENKARTELATTLTNGYALTPGIIETVLRAQAEAAVWKRVLRVMEHGHTATEALAKVRADRTEYLLGFGESQSTSALRNEEERLAREAARTFLRLTAFAA